MGILNVTPDSFSDGGLYSDIDHAIRRADEMIAEGVDIIDIGGESTRPGSSRVDAETEINRTLPVVAAIARRFDIPISIDTSKSSVANALVDHGAEIINDISGLRWDEEIAKVATESGTGLVLMHSRGSFETMHNEPPVENALNEVRTGLESSLATARKWGVSDEQIVLDIGIGFGKTPEQNLELIAKLDRIKADFAVFPMLVGASRKSFIGKLLGGVLPEDRLAGSIAAHTLAIWNGAAVIRTHDVRESVQLVKVGQGLLECR